MNLCAIQQKAFFSMEETKRSVSPPVSDGRDDDVLCPKPRRFNLLIPSMNEQSSRPLRRNSGHHSDSELCDSNTGIDLLDLLLRKGGCVGAQSVAQLDPSPLFTCGSPPSRVSNPLIQDARFGAEKSTLFLPSSPIIHPVSDQSLEVELQLDSSPIMRLNFGHNPAVRVDGFDCIARERGHCSILSYA